jgi:hypothetical protein
VQPEVRWYDTITVNAHWLALTTRAQVLGPLVRGFVGEADKGSYVGIARPWDLAMAILAQAWMGLRSDPFAPDDRPRCVSCL